jgi:hypothetical protein
MRGKRKRKRKKEQKLKLLVSLPRCQLRTDDRELREGGDVLSLLFC